LIIVLRLPIMVSDDKMTEKQNILAKYKELENRYESLFEGTMELVYVCRPDSRIVSINSFGAKLLGYSSPPELAGVPLVDLYYNPSDRDYYNQIMNKQGHIKDFEIILKKKDGTRLIGQETSRLIRDEAGNPVECTGIIRDITERVRNEMLLMKKNTELLMTNKRLEEAQLKIMRQDKLAAIGQLAAGVAHEINNPLGFIKSSCGSLKQYMRNIRGYLEQLELLARETAADTGRNQTGVLDKLKDRFKIDVILQDFNELYNDMNEGFERISSIVNGLKNFSYIDKVQKRGRYDLNKGINDTLQILNNELKYTAKVEKNLSPLPEIECFGGEINQVLLNIILNAAQAIRSQKRKSPGKINISTKAEGNFILCAIADDGPGIPDENIDKIFDPFFTTKEIGEGTGLGLNISYDIITKHQGEFGVQSREGGGAVFTIKLPVVFHLEEEVS